MILHIHFNNFDKNNEFPDNWNMWEHKIPSTLYRIDTQLWKLYKNAYNEGNKIQYAAYAAAHLLASPLIETAYMAATVALFIFQAFNWNQEQKGTFAMHAIRAIPYLLCAPLCGPVFLAFCMIASTNTAPDAIEATKKEAYNILKIEQGATQDDIKRAYRQLALKYHPDRNQSRDQTRMKELNNAHQYLLTDNVFQSGRICWLNILLSETEADEPYRVVREERRITG